MNPLDGSAGESGVTDKSGITFSLELQEGKHINKLKTSARLSARTIDGLFACVETLRNLLPITACPTVLVLI